jgi:monothiol glutaredoxin
LAAVFIPAARPSEKELAMSIKDNIQSTIDENDVVLFMKGTPKIPQCGFSGQVVSILNAAGVPFQHVNCLENDEIRQGIKEFSSWPTIPQLYIKGEFIGGCDIVREMYQSGELTAYLTDKGIAARQAAKA